MCELRRRGTSNCGLFFESMKFHNFSSDDGKVANQAGKRVPDLILGWFSRGWGQCACGERHCQEVAAMK